jgi:hypothetical protein
VENEERTTTHGNNEEIYSVIGNNTNYHQDKEDSEEQCKKANINNDISIDEESPEYTYVMINDIKTIDEMNAGRLNVNPETAEEITKVHITMSRTYKNKYEL